MNPKTKTAAILSLATAFLFLGAGLAMSGPGKKPEASPAAATATPTIAPVAAPAGPLVVAPPPASAFGDALKLTASDLVRVSPALSHPVLLAGGPREVYLKANVTAKPQTPASATRREPVQLALVIDCSGSMDGEKMEHTKQAAAGVVRLLEDGDRIVIVSYETYASTVLPSLTINSETRARALAAIEGLRAVGSTNLSGGVQQATTAMLADKEADHSVRRMVLLSDGQANMGETRNEKLFAIASDLRDRGIALSSLGVGIDFNTQLMEGLAEHGGGRFRFLENAPEIAAAFAKELKLAATLVASDVRIVLHPADGVQIEDVYGSLFERVGNDVVVRITDLASTTEIRVLARLTVQASSPTLNVLEIAATYADVATDRARGVTRVPMLTARTTSSSSEVAAAENRDVLTYAINGRGIADARRAIELFDQGKRDEALKSLDVANATVATANTRLNAPELAGSISIFGNLRSLFASSANALGGEQYQDANLRTVKRKRIANFGTNTMGNE